MNARIKAFINKIKLPVPPVIFGVLFIFNIIFAKLVKEINYNFDIQGITEIKETVFALVLFMLPLAWMNIKTFKKPSLIKGNGAQNS